MRPMRTVAAYFAERRLRDTRFVSLLVCWREQLPSTREVASPYDTYLGSTSITFLVGITKGTHPKDVRPLRCHCDTYLCATGMWFGFGGWAGGQAVRHPLDASTVGGPTLRGGGWLPEPTERLRHGEHPAQRARDEGQSLQT